MKLLLTAVIIVTLLAILGGAFEEKTPQQRAEADERYRKVALKTDAKTAVERLLKDPGSAKFRSVLIVKNDGVEVVCGEVNSKNGFGAYTGYQYFLSVAGKTMLQEQAPDFAKAWNRLCVR